MPNAEASRCLDRPILRKYVDDGMVYAMVSDTGPQPVYRDTEGRVNPAHGHSPWSTQGCGTKSDHGITSRGARHGNGRGVRDLQATAPSGYLNGCILAHCTFAEQASQSSVCFATDIQNSMPGFFCSS